MRNYTHTFFRICIIVCYVDIRISSVGNHQVRSVIRLPKNVLQKDTFEDIWSYRKETKDCNGSSARSFPENNCYCDNKCSLTEDCCKNYSNQGDEARVSLHASFLSCVWGWGIVPVENCGVKMVTSCSSLWTEVETEQLCMYGNYRNDIFVGAPVSEESKPCVIYINMYCAYCNHVYDFSIWKMDIRDDKSIAGYIGPNADASYQLCLLDGGRSVISTCRYRIPTVSQHCTEGKYDLVHSKGKMYKNIFCAVCNQAMKSDDPEVHPPQLFTPPLSYRTLVDFNEKIKTNDVGQSQRFMQCQDDEMYDPVKNTCRKLWCKPPLAAIKGRCIVHRQTTEEDSVQNLRNYDESFTDKPGTYLFSQPTNSTTPEFEQNGTEFMPPNDAQSYVMLPSDETERYLSMVGLILSIVALAITILIYVSFPRLLNTPGKLLLGLMLSLFIAQFLFLVSSMLQRFCHLCICVGILMHYFFLAAFCWTNVIALDLSLTFSNKFTFSGSEAKHCKRLAFYNMYAWLLPLVIVAVAVILDNIELKPEFTKLKPMYGKSLCWISSKDALLFFFAAPLALFKSFDIISFIFTAFQIAKANRQGAVARRNRERRNPCSLIINLKLSLVMGLAWVFAFVANATNYDFLWYLFIIFNTLQGFFIAVCFLFTKTAVRMIREKYNLLKLL